MTAMMNFESIYQKYSQDVFRFALSLCRDRAWAEDLTAETFTRLWAAFGKIEQTTLKAYLIAICRNLFLHEQRTSTRRAELPDEVKDGSPDSAELTIQRDELEWAYRQIATLPEVDRSALLMSVEAGMSYGEIASALGITVSSAKVKIHRARLRLIKARKERSICEHN